MTRFCTPFDHRHIEDTICPESYKNIQQTVVNKTTVHTSNRWVENIRMDLHEVGCGYMDWNGLAQDRDRWRTLVSAVMILRVP